jgi:hypothetical protein
MNNLPNMLGKLAGPGGYARNFGRFGKQSAGVISERRRSARLSRAGKLTTLWRKPGPSEVARRLPSSGPSARNASGPSPTSSRSEAMSRRSPNAFETARFFELLRAATHGRVRCGIASLLHSARHRQFHVEATASRAFPLPPALRVSGFVQGPGRPHGRGFLSSRRRNAARISLCAPSGLR